MARRSAVGPDPGCERKTWASKSVKTTVIALICIYPTVVWVKFAMIARIVARRTMNAIRAFWPINEGKSGSLYFVCNIVCNVCNIVCNVCNIVCSVCNIVCNVCNIVCNGFKTALMPHVRSSRTADNVAPPSQWPLATNPTTVGRVRAPPTRRSGAQIAAPPRQQRQNGRCCCCHSKAERMGRRSI